MRLLALIFLISIVTYFVWWWFNRRRGTVPFEKARRELYHQLDRRARKGDEDAMYRIAKLFYQEKDSQYYEFIYKWVQILAAMEKDPAVWLELGDMLEGGYGTDKDLKRALRTYEQALSFDSASSKRSSLSLEAHNYLEEKIIELRRRMSL